MSDTLAINLLKPFSAAETALISAIVAHLPCDLPAQGITEDRHGTADIAEWGVERHIRSEVLLAAMEPERVIDRGSDFRIKALSRIELRGAVITGECLSLKTDRVGELSLRNCRFDCEIEFNGLTFSEKLDFTNCTFNNDVRMKSRFRNCVFDEARFRGAVDFTGANFATDSSFEGAYFYREASFNQVECAGHLSFGNCRFEAAATFREGSLGGDGKFGGAKFLGQADFTKRNFQAIGDFSNVVFSNGASFTEATFGRTALFRETTFGDKSIFNRTKFNGKSHFEKSIFAGSVDFSESTFADNFVCIQSVFASGALFDRILASAETTFSRSTFAHTASFVSARLKGANFMGACAKKWNFEGAQFDGARPGPWIGRSINLTGAVFASRSRVSVCALSVKANGMQARESIQLQVASNYLDLSESEFFRPSDVSPWISASDSIKDTLPRGIRNGTERGHLGNSAIEQAAQFRKDLAALLRAMGPQCRLMSLAQAAVGELALSGVVLDDCIFSGAHGLDKLRFGADCTFATMDRWFQGVPSSRRRVLAEDLAWRRCYTGLSYRAVPDSNVLPAFKIASIYRNLRKGLEDSKNEPGAAEFYYGEMEMRRLSRRKAPLPVGRQKPDARRSSETSSRIERSLLYVYWALSGYGLRASRTLAALVLIVLFCAFLYTQPSFATLAPSPPVISRIEPDGTFTREPAAAARPPNFAVALEFSARESVSLLQIGKEKTLDTHGLGVCVEIFLRLAGPALLALAILAVRARTKR